MTYKHALRPCPGISAQWITVSESGTYTLFQTGYGPGVYERELSCAEALQLLALMGVMG